MNSVRRAAIVVGLGFGDCGKGSIVDFMARDESVHTIVRFNGGPQAGHNVVTSDGRHHTFSQFGSGTFANDRVSTLLSRFMLIEPYALLNEAAHLQQLGCGNIWDRLFIDERCVVITPVHQAMNRLRERARGNEAHGTCGLGAGETTADALERPDLTIHARDLGDAERITAKLQAVVSHKQRQLNTIVQAIEDDPSAQADIETVLRPQWIEVAVEMYCEVGSAARIISPKEATAILRLPGQTIFEGAQGALLDEDYGFHPHTTWSKTTPANAIGLLREAGITGGIRRIGVLRSYMTRHGRGPFVSEQFELRAAVPERHNADAGNQGVFRVGVFDAVAARYAASVSGVDEIAMTHLDLLAKLPDYICTAYTSCEGFVSASRTDIVKVDPSDLNSRAAQTRAITACRPICTSIQMTDSDDFIHRIGCELQLPVRICSFGATAEDKRVMQIKLRQSHVGS